MIPATDFEWLVAKLRATSEEKKGTEDGGEVGGTRVGGGYEKVVQRSRQNRGWGEGRRGEGQTTPATDAKVASSKMG